MNNKKVLGLDLGVGSVGWALIETQNDVPDKIVAMGSRIVPVDPNELNNFATGNAISINAKRTLRRTSRKGYDRYQLRRNLLTQALRQNNMLPDSMQMNVFELWKLRANAATDGCKLSLKEIGRVLYHINQKRGYMHAKSDVSADKKQTEYVAAVNKRWDELQEEGITLGQHFYKKLLEGKKTNEDGRTYSTFRIKDNIYPRSAHIAEFDKIIQVQRQFYPDVLTDEFIKRLRNYIIFYQRQLRSCKHLVSLCEFEMKPYKKADGSIVYDGPKVAPRTAPLAQLCKIWESVNKLKLTNRKGEQYEFTLEERRRMVEFLDNHEKMTLSDLYKILGITKKDGWFGSKEIGRGLQGNITKCQLRKALGGIAETEQLLKMDIELQNSEIVDIETGEVLPIIASKVEQEPLYTLWHAVYSIKDKQELASVLKKKYKITDCNIIDNLYNLDFVTPGYTNKSLKFIRRLLPYLQQGLMYSEACDYIDVNHSGSLTKKENEKRPLLEKLKQLEKNELRQPIVEKILNQMVSVVNALIDRYGKIDEIRVELARELKQSRDNRAEADKAMRKNEIENKRIIAILNEHGCRPSRARIQKYKLWEETNRFCMYCGNPITLTDFVNGIDMEREHIIPRSVLFDDSFSNKVCSCRACNHAKGNMTAYDYMRTRSDEEFNAYLNRVQELYNQKRISKTKRDHLLWRLEDIPNDYIDRQLRLTQYITKKAMEMLRTICHDVNATSGGVTDFLRHEWGYDEILHSLNLSRYRLANLTQMVTTDNYGATQTVERIKNWTKRLDHRHHAIDALVTALTRQGYIQRLNTLNASREQMIDELNQCSKKNMFEEKKSLLQKWIAVQPHFSVAYVTKIVDGILISFRAGKRVTSPGTNTYKTGKEIEKQKGLVIPRGALCEESVYGRVNGRYVIKYPLIEIKLKNKTDKKTGDIIEDKLEYIVDPHIRELILQRLKTFDNNPKAAFAEPLYSDEAQTMQIRTVRCDTGLDKVTPIKYNSEGKPIGFVKPGNNHHVAIYKDKNGIIHESVVTFWNAVERKRWGLPVIIESPSEVWTKILDMDLPQSFLETLPADDWEFVISLQQNEMFIMDMPEEDYQYAMQNNDNATLGKYLYRVQKLTSGDYWFRSHIETRSDDKYDNGDDNKTKIQTKISTAMKKLITATENTLFVHKPHKVRINILGEISEA